MILIVKNTLSNKETEYKFNDWEDLPKIAKDYPALDKFFTYSRNFDDVLDKTLDYFNSHGMWPWSDSTINLYVSSTNKNPYIRTYSKDAVGYARKIYNEKAILELLSNQTNEGLFKINGVQVEGENSNMREQLPDGFGSFPYTSGLMEDRRKDIIKCNLDTQQPERTRFQGRGGIFGEQLSEVSPVNYNELETIIPGFSFLSAPCNPCLSDNKCQFKLNVKPTKLF